MLLKTVIISLVIVANAQQLHVQQGHDKCSRHYVCPPEFLRLSQNCYYFSKDRNSWQDAYFSCRDRHGKLAMLRSAYEDKMLRTFLNKVSLASHERWIGGMYDWEQMMWKWPASGKEIKYKGFSRVNQEKKENLQWHCIVLDPHLQYKWATRSCLEKKHYICQTKLKKIAKKDRKKLKRQYNVTKYNKLNEVPVPTHTDYNIDNNLVPSKLTLAYESNVISKPEYGTYGMKNQEERKKNMRRKRKRNYDPCETVVSVNGTRYEIPRPKYGKRRRRNKNKENGKNRMNEKKSYKNEKVSKLKTHVYYGNVPRSPLHPRIITEEHNFS